MDASRRKTARKKAAGNDLLNTSASDISFDTSRDDCSDEETVEVVNEPLWATSSREVIVPAAMPRSKAVNPARLSWESNPAVQRRRGGTNI